LLISNPGRVRRIGVALYTVRIQYTGDPGSAGAALCYNSVVAWALTLATRVYRDCIHQAPSPIVAFRRSAATRSADATMVRQLLLGAISISSWLFVDTDFTVMLLITA